MSPEAAGSATAAVQPPSAAPVELGTMLYTLVEPHPGHARAYNRWYERDHFYAGCLTGGYCFAGRRFVATRPLKELRYPDRSPRGSYLAVYWVLAGHVEQWNRWAVDQVNLLHRSGRMFAARDHVHTLLYDFRSTAARDQDGVPAELGLDHPFRGLVAVRGRTAGDPEPVLGRLAEAVPGWLAGTDAALALTFTPRPLSADAPADVPREDTGDRFMQLYFTDREPADAWPTLFAGLGDRLATLGADVELVAPFQPTLPGTDRYVDEL